MSSDTPSPYPSDMPPPIEPYPSLMPPAPIADAPYAGGGTAPTMVAPPPPPPPAPVASSGGGGGGLAITGLIFAIIAMLMPLLALFAAFSRLPRVTLLLLLAAIPLAIIGIVLSAVGRSAVRQRASASAGLVLGIVALVLAVGVLLFALAAARGPVAGPGRFGPPRRRLRPAPQGQMYRAAPTTGYASGYDVPV